MIVEYFHDVDTEVLNQRLQSQRTTNYAYQILGSADSYERILKIIPILLWMQSSNALSLSTWAEGHLWQDRRGFSG